MDLLTIISFSSHGEGHPEQPLHEPEDFEKNFLIPEYSTKPILPEIIINMTIS